MDEDRQGSLFQHGNIRVCMMGAAEFLYIHVKVGNEWLTIYKSFGAPRLSWGLEVQQMADLNLIREQGAAFEAYMQRNPHLQRLWLSYIMMEGMRMCEAAAHNELQSSHVFLPKARL